MGRGLRASRVCLGRLLRRAPTILPPAAMTAADAHRAILAVWRIEQPRLITSLARMLRDVPLAEDLTQEALLAALERWPPDRRSRKTRRLADGECHAPGVGSFASPPDA